MWWYGSRLAWGSPLPGALLRVDFPTVSSPFPVGEEEAGTRHHELDQEWRWLQVGGRSRHSEKLSRSLSRVSCCCCSLSRTPPGPELFSASPAPGRPPMCEDARTACGAALESALVPTGQAHRSPIASRARRWLVHRKVGDGGPPGGQGLAIDIPVCFWKATQPV